MPRKVDINSLFYITHVDNVPSILTNGILSHGQIKAQNVPFTPIYDDKIVSRRKEKTTPDGKSLWEYANVYFQARNPMMYRVVHEKSKRDLAVVGVKPSVLQLPSVFITDGNAANHQTQFFRSGDGLKMIEAQWKVVHSEWWNDRDGSKRKIMAECLVPERIPSEYIHTIYVTDRETQKQVAGLLGPTSIPVVPEPNVFFSLRMLPESGRTFR